MVGWRDDIWVIISRTFGIGIAVARDAVRVCAEGDAAGGEQDGVGESGAKRRPDYAPPRVSRPAGR